MEQLLIVQILGSTSLSLLVLILHHDDIIRSEIGILLVFLFNRLSSKVNQFVSLFPLGPNCGFLIRCGFVIRGLWSADQIFVLVWDSCSNSCPRRCIKRRQRGREREEVEKAAEKCGSFDPRPCWWSRRQWQCGVKDVNVKKENEILDLQSSVPLPRWQMIQLTLHPSSDGQYFTQHICPQWQIND